MSGSQSTGTPDIPIDAFGEAVRLLGSIPRTVSPAEWFGVVAPQLPDMSRGKGGGLCVLDIEIVGLILK